MPILSLRPSLNRVSQAVLKAAKKRIEHAISRNRKNPEMPLTRTEYVRLQKLVELYLKTLDLRVVQGDGVRVKLGDFCQTNNSTPLTFLVDNYIPNKTKAEMKQNAEYLLEPVPDLEDIIFDDFLELQPPDLEALAAISGPFKVAKLLRKIGEPYYLSLESQRRDVIRDL